MFEFVWNLASFVIVLGILVTAHEYGHFWVARKCGVKVKRFSVGFGKVLWRKEDKQGTEFVIAAIPLGGYVSMLDERVEPVDESLKSQAFNNKSVYQRIAIIAAGPLANFVLAIVAFYLMFLIGLPGVKPIISDVAPNSIAAQASVPKNVELVAINDTPTKDWQAVNMALVANIGEPSITLHTKADDTNYIVTQKLDTSAWQFEPSESSAITSLGLVPYRPKVTPVITQVAEGSAAQKAGLLAGDTILSINDVVIEDDWQQLVSEIQRKPEQQVTLTILRSGREQLIQVTPQGREVNGKLTGYLGVSPTVAAWPEHYLIELVYGPIEAFTKSIERCWELIRLSFDMIGKLITGDVSVKNLSGPISIAQGAGHSVGYGFVYFLSFLALISINLGIINLLPLPILDGGHLLYYLIELFTGKPVPEKVQELGFRIGAIALLSLMSIAIFNDLSRL